MKSLRFYGWMSRARFLSFRAKIMVMAFLGTHIPLIALASFYAFRTATSWGEVARSVGVTLAATLAGTAATLWVLDQLLRPILATSAALRAYRAGRVLPALPTGFPDEAGTLMADAQGAMADLEGILARLESVDEATGALNRQGFLAQAGEAGAGDVGTGEVGGSEVGAVVVIRFVNHHHLAQSLGHDAMIKALRRLATRLATRLGPEARVARVADADVAAVLAAAPDDDGLALRDLLLELGHPMEVNGVKLSPVLAAGVAATGPDRDVATALDDAASAIAVASEAAPVAVHSTGLRSRLRERFLLEQDLRAAIRNEEFVLHFQPIMDLDAGRPAGAEALIRWQSPSRGLVAPGAFLPVAEAAGLMEPIGRWVLREACRQVATWDPSFRVAINLGAPQFMDEDLAWHVMEAAGAAGVTPQRLEIELTESVAMVDHDHTRRAFGSLRDMGVHIAIDDFGTGYASMSTLRKLPFDKLKIDREFVSGVHRTPGSQAICEAMIALARGLDLRVLAEGTEAAEEVAYLAARGCGLFQGYHFSRPVPAAALPGAFAALERPTPARKAS